jgi:ABC-type phosphate/phosphonate transport system permease subunit
MKQIRTIFGFSVAFFVALVVIFTFRQEPFRQPVKAWVPFYQNVPELAVYWYVAGAFILGIAVGLFWVLLTYIGSRARLSRKSKEAKDLEQEVARLKTVVDELRRGGAPVQAVGASPVYPELPTQDL